MATHLISLPSYPSAKNAVLNPLDVVQNWVTRTADVFGREVLGVDDLQDIFAKDGWLRDHLIFSWDLRTLHGLHNVQSYLKSSDDSRILNLRLDLSELTPSLENADGDLPWISAILNFETRTRRGRAVVRLVNTGGNKWKAFCLYMTLHDLVGSEQQIKERRIRGGNYGVPGEGLQPTWLEQRRRQESFIGSEPDVIVIGAGQAGLSIAARLHALGLTTLIVDKNERVGDNWRKRYRTLVTHDPVQVSHLPYMPFPENWPLYTPKDKLGDWFECYAKALDLNVWNSTSVQSAKYDDHSQKWTVELLRSNGHQPTLRTFYPRHIVMATGHSGEPKIPDIPGKETFKGKLYHGSEHDDAVRLDVKGKKVVVVGSGNSGHDVAQNFYENGADVTLLQRGGTSVISVSNATGIIFGDALDESGSHKSMDTRDLLAHSFPIPLQFVFAKTAMAHIREADKKLLEGLERAGFKLDFGIDGAGPARLYLTRGGGYYIDVGCSRLIADGLIQVKSSPGGIKKLDTKGMILGDDSRLDADIIVLCTGYDNMKTTVAKILGDAVGNRCKDVWDLDEEGELNAVWRPSGHPGFWYMAGNLAHCRPYSKLLAFQIKACEMGLNPSYKYGADGTEPRSRL